MFGLFLSGLGCSKVPRNILSEKEMRAVLLDMQLAESLIAVDYKYTDKDPQKEAIYRSVFAKHRIDEAKYDSSLLWYGRNLDLYMRVYENVVKDLNKLKLALGDYASENLPMRSRDSVQLWDGSKSFDLKDNILDNTWSFNIDPSDGFMAGSKFLLSMNIWGIPSDTLYYPVLRVHIEQADTTLSFEQKIRIDGLLEALFVSDSSQVVRRVSGSIRMHQSEPVLHEDSIAQRDSLLYIDEGYSIHLDSISLMRYHQNTEVELVSLRDSI